MNKFEKNPLPVFILLLLSFFTYSQDAIEVDPEHYKVEVENDKVRVLRINYKPGEESKMHMHPEGVAVFLTDHKANMKTENGTSVELTGNKGDVAWVDRTKHQPSNTGTNAFEVIQIELKHHNTRAGKKSLHLFELPDGISEKKLSDFLKKMNKAISDEGYPEAGYHLYKITSKNETYTYFMEGIWPDTAIYDKIHESPGWKAAADSGKEMIDKIRANELYLKAEKLE